MKRTFLALFFVFFFPISVFASAVIVFPPSEQGLSNDYEYFELVRAVDSAALSAIGSRAIRPAELVPIFVKMRLIKTDLETFKILSQSELGLTLLEPDENSVEKLRLLKPERAALQELARKYRARYGLFVSVRISESEKNKRSFTKGARSFVFGRPKTKAYDAFMRAAIFGTAGFVVSPLAALPLSAYAVYSAVSERAEPAFESEISLFLIDLVRLETARAVRFKVVAGSKESLLKAFSTALSEEMKGLLSSLNQDYREIFVDKKILIRQEKISATENRADSREADDVFPSLNVGHGARPGFRTSF